MRVVGVLGVVTVASSSPDSWDAGTPTLYATEAWNTAPTWSEPAPAQSWVQPTFQVETTSVNIYIPEPVVYETVDWNQQWTPEPVIYETTDWNQQQWNSEPVIYETTDWNQQQWNSEPVVYETVDWNQQWTPEPVVDWNQQWTPEPVVDWNQQLTPEPVVDWNQQWTPEPVVDWNQPAVEQQWWDSAAAPAWNPEPAPEWPATIEGIPMGPGPVILTPEQQRQNAVGNLYEVGKASTGETTEVSLMCPFGGIPSSDLAVCCPSSCGTCGGEGCGERPGGSTDCCRTVIIENEMLCTAKQASPCVIPGAGLLSNDYPDVLPRPGKRNSIPTFE